MDKELKIKIRVDKDTGAVSIIGSEFNALTGHVESTNKSIINTTQSLVNMAKGAVGLYAIKEAFEAVLKTGFAFNASMEDAIAGFSSLDVATSSNISVMGKHLSITEKYAIAQRDAIHTAQELAKINVQTPHTLTQTNEIYKALYIGMKNAGASSEDMITLTKQLSIAAGSAGIEFNSLLAGVDGLATGTVEISSDFGRFLGGLGLTNEALKDTDNIVKLLEDRLSQFKAADTMKVAVSNLTNEWEMLSGVLTKDIFEVSRENIKESTVWLAEYRGQVHSFFLQFKDTTDIKSVEDINIRLLQLRRELTDEESISTEFMWNADKKVRDERIKSIQDEIALLQKRKNEEVATPADHLQKAEFKRDDNAAGKALFELDEFSKKMNKDYIDELDAISKKQNKIAEEKAKMEEEKQKARNDLDAMSLKLYLEHEGQRVEKAKKSQDALNDLNAMSLEIYLKNEKDKQDAADRWDALMQDNYSSALDSQIALANATQDWQNGLTGVAGAFAAISKSMSALHVKELNFLKAEDSLSKKIAKQAQEAAGDDAKLAQVGLNYSKEKSALDRQNTQNQLEGYGQLAGAMSGAFAEGSDSSKAFLLVQQGIGLVMGVNAVLAAASAPPPSGFAMAAAMTATVTSLLAIAGIAFSSGGGSSAPQMSEQERMQASLDLQFEPMLDRLDTQIDLLKMIEKNGSASQSSLEKAKIQFEYDIKTYANTQNSLGATGKIDSKDNAGVYFGNGGLRSPDSVTKYKNLTATLESEYGIDASGLYSTNNGDRDLYSFGGKLIDTKNDLLAYVANRDEIEATAAEILGTSTMGKKQISDEYFAKITADVQGFIGEFAVAIGDSVNELISMSDDFESLYDSITGTTTYADAKLKKAQEEVNALLSGTNGAPDLTTYLAQQIEGISKLEKAYGTSIENILSSNDPADIQEQAKAVLDLQAITGAAFDGGAKEALNYLESIDLVGNAMADNAKLVADTQQKLNDAFLGSYSPLSMLQKTEYANTLPLDITSTNAVESAYLALQTAAASAVRDEDIALAFNSYISVLESQVDDASRQDIVDKLDSVNTILSSLYIQVQRIDQTIGA